MWRAASTSIQDVWRRPVLLRQPSADRCAPEPRSPESRLSQPRAPVDDAARDGPGGDAKWRAARGALWDRDRGKYPASDGGSVFRRCLDACDAGPSFLPGQEGETGWLTSTRRRTFGRQAARRVGSSRGSRDGEAATGALRTRKRACTQPQRPRQAAPHWRHDRNRLNPSAATVRTCAYGSDATKGISG